MLISNTFNGDGSNAQIAIAQIAIAQIVIARHFFLEIVTTQHKKMLQQTNNCSNCDCSNSDCFNHNFSTSAAVKS
jgi:hypothetical protein